jgi:hypothetical protein
MISCEKDNPCDILENGVYPFPELPEDHDMTSQEVTEYWDLPKDICDCITTEGLIETCLNYPDLRLISAGANPQSGYDMVAERFRGFRELSSRSDRAKYLLKKYRSIDPEIDRVDYLVNNIWYYQIILSQYENLEAFTNIQEKIELIEIAIETYDKLKANKEHIFSLSTTTVVMARLMKLDNYQPFLDVYAENDIVWKMVECYLTTYEAVGLIYTLSKDYLQTLKSTK